MLSMRSFEGAPVCGLENNHGPLLDLGREHHPGESGRSVRDPATSSQSELLNLAYAGGGMPIL